MRVMTVLGAPIILFMAAAAAAGRTPSFLPPEYLVTDAAPSGVFIGWFNSGGDADLVLIRDNSVANGEFYGVAESYMGNGDGSFGDLWDTVSLYYDPRAFAVGDFDRDGSWDLAIANSRCT